MKSIGVCISSYNQRAWLVEAVESVLAQTRLPDAVVIVDDGSTDGSQETIRDFERRTSGLVRGIFHEENQGISAVRNTGIRALDTEYISCLDGDDRWLPEKLEMETEALRGHAGVRFAHSNFRTIDMSGAPLGVWCDGNAMPEGDVFVQVFARLYPGDALFRSELVPREAALAAGLYDPSMSLYEDYDFKIRLARDVESVYCDRVLVEYRQSPAGLSRVPKGEHLRVLAMIYARYSLWLRERPEPEAQKADARLRRKLSALCLAVGDDLKHRRNEAGESSHESRIPYTLLGLRYDWKYTLRASARRLRRTPVRPGDS